MIKFSVITVAYQNKLGITETYRSLKKISKKIIFEWIVIDGGSNDGTEEYLKKMDNEYNLRYVSEKDNGIYDAMNKGIQMANNDYCIFLNSGDIFHNEINVFIENMIKLTKNDNEIYIGNALLNFGNGEKSMRKAKNGLYIYHSLPASHQAMFFPTCAIKNNPYDLQFKVSSDYALAAKLYKQGFRFRKLEGIVSEFSMGGISTINSEQLCNDAKLVQSQILKIPKPFVTLSYILRKYSTSKTKNSYQKNEENK